MKKFVFLILVMLLAPSISLAGNVEQYDRRPLDTVLTTYVTTTDNSTNATFTIPEAYNKARFLFRGPGCPCGSLVFFWEKILED